MKLTAFLIMATFLQASTRGYSQKVTLSMNNASLGKVFREITRQTGYSFLYTDEVLNGIPKVDIRVKDVPLETALDRCFNNQPLTYSIVEHTVIIKRKQEPPPPPGIAVHGLVTDSTGSPMSGVSVTIAGSTKGVQTNADGMFAINVPERASLHFSFVGYDGVDVPVENKTTINVTLLLSATSLNDMVFIGYGSQRRKDITAAISTVGVSDVSVRPVLLTAAEVLWQAMSPGVRILQPSGKPGADFAVFVRGIASLTGNTQPLYVIDGVVSYDTHTLDPNTIQSISILKDASAAGIYGAAGSTNGVVLITTKKGIKGKSRVDVNAYSGIQEITKKDKAA